ncbi:MAG: hypothetical protein R2743_16770 [Ilumatobacteraceae bacterium]
MITTQTLRRAREQRPIRQEVATSEEHLGQGSEALAAREPARTDRANTTIISDADHVQPVEERSPQRDPSHPGHLVTSHRRHHRSNLTNRTDDDLASIEQRHGNVHLSGAPLAGTGAISQSTSSQAAEHLSRQTSRSTHHRCNIRV